MEAVSAATCILWGVSISSYAGPVNVLEVGRGKKLLRLDATSETEAAVQPIQLRD